MFYAGDTLARRGTICGSSAADIMKGKDIGMKVQNNITVFTGDTQNNVQAERAAKDSRLQDGRNKTIYAGNFLTEFPLRDRIQQRRAQAQERALKIVSDAWDGDKQIDDEIGRSRDRIKELKEQYKELLEVKSAMRSGQEELEKEGNTLSVKLKEGEDAVSLEPEDSEEAAFMEKAYTARLFPWAEVEFTEEELKRFEEMDTEEITGYMKDRIEQRAAAWKSGGTVGAGGEAGGPERAGDEIDRLLYKLGKEIEMENAVIRGIRGEQRKHHSMLDAQKQAEDVMAAARDEIVGLVVEEAKEHIDEEQEKREEESEAIKEKKEEQEKILEERKEEEEELEKLIEEMPIEDMADLKNMQEEVRQEVQNIVNKMNLVAEDIKGAMVDTVV